MAQQHQSSGPAQLVLIDDLDHLALGVGVALDGLLAVTQLIEGQGENLDVDGRRIAALLRCIHSRATEGWPMGRPYA